MPNIRFTVDDIAPIARSATPTLGITLRIIADGARIHSIMLRCQIQIEAPRRPYSDSEKEQLFDLFGEPSDWGRTLHNISWTEISVCVPGFEDQTLINLPLACTHDFNVAATKYLHALEDADVPLRLNFSGTVFHASDGAPLHVGQIPWETEAKCRLPGSTWRELMQRYYPDCIWTALPQPIVDGLREYQRRFRLPSLERALEELLASQNIPMSEGSAP